MSERDRGLLAAAGLSIAEAADVFCRSRQAMYQGLSHDRDYLSAKDAVMTLQHARRADSSRIDELIKFIEKNYTSEEKGLILPERVAYNQLHTVISNSDDVIVICNGNVSSLETETSFGKILRFLLESTHISVALAVPGDWVFGYVSQTLKLRLPPLSHVVEEVAHLPSFIILRAKTGFRAFFFGRLSVEEVSDSDAQRLWEHFWPKFSQSSLYRSQVSR